MGAPQIIQSRQGYSKKTGKTITNVGKPGNKQLLFSRYTL